MVTLFRKKRPKQTFACYNSQDAQKGLVNLDDWHIYNYLNPFSAIYNYVRPPKLICVAGLPGSCRAFAPAWWQENSENLLARFCQRFG